MTNKVHAGLELGEKMVSVLYVNWDDEASRRFHRTPEKKIQNQDQLSITIIDKMF